MFLKTLRLEKFSREIFSSSEADLFPDEISPVTNFVKIYFDFAYFLLLSPFRLVYDRNRPYEKFQTTKWKPHQVVCGTVQALCFLSLLTVIRRTFPTELSKTDQRNPVQYFNLITETASFFYKLVIVKRFWCNQEDYRHVVNFADQEFSNLEPSHMFGLSTSTFCYLVFSLYTSMALSSVLVGKFFASGDLYLLTPSWWYRRLVVITRYSFFYSDSSWLKSTDKAPEFRDISAIDVFLSVPMLISLIIRYLYGFFVDLGVLALTLTLWITARSFETRINQNNALTYRIPKKEQNDVIKLDHDILTWPEVYRMFTTIRRLSIFINNALGHSVTCFLTEAVMYYSVSLHGLITPSDPFLGVNQVFYYTCTFSILFFAADICKKLESVKAWMSNNRNRKDIPDDEMIIVLHEMLAKDIAIQGSRIFSVTYGFVAAFISSIVTYFVICVQYDN